MGKVLVIGANGFIAKHTASKFEQQGIAYLPTSRNNLDIEKEESIRSFCEKQNDTFDAVLFFQGLNPGVNTKDMTSEHFSRMLNVNLIGPALLLKHLHSKLEKGAMLLFISSIAAQKGSYDPSYASAKAGITGLMNSLANEFSNFRFNSIVLGLVKDSPVYTGMTPDFRKRHADGMGGGFVRKEDVGSAIIELLQNDSINRAEVRIDRGFKS
jgi:3-oxoacyl-[acyl-carrier protein] reductase